MNNYSDNELEAIDANLDKINENLKHLVRAVDDLTSAVVASEGEKPESNYRV